MHQPEITEDQRLMAVALLANAIRKDSHLRSRSTHAQELDNTLQSIMADNRSKVSQRYIEGMCDIVRVLFAGGSALAESCLEEAYAQALGVAKPDSPDGMEYQ